MSGDKSNTRQKGREMSQTLRRWQREPLFLSLLSQLVAGAGGWAVKADRLNEGISCDDSLDHVVADL